MKEDDIMKKENYERAELEVIRFMNEDVIMTTGELEPDEYETPRIP